ncbi:hypothetical protein [Mammaliicoccus sciuri]|uniref:hypothetical protein n=1 Tax=Mammaliicoccus sciuri TaxID=1296 RepID=UPI001E309DCE|nr:hypothetical protein [Mammaliicoccus sciuri]MCD8896552.1 hypothetical protein [Mammaliicoccus sciuri]
MENKKQIINLVKNETQIILNDAFKNSDTFAEAKQFIRKESEKYSYEKEEKIIKDIHMIALENLNEKMYATKINK